MAAWVRRNDQQGLFEDVAYQDAPSPPMNPDLLEACSRSSHVITKDGQILRAGRGTVFILQQLGWKWMRIFSVPPMIWLVEAGYATFARNRHFFFRILSALFSRRA